MKKIALMFLSALAVATCGQKDDPTPDPTPAAPTSITLSVSSKSVAQAGESFDVTVTAPARPTLTLPTWITKTDGTFKDYKITFKLNVAANDSYDERTGEVTFAATGVSSVKLTVTQEGKVDIPDPTLPNNSAVARMKEMGLGWNMGNHFDAINNGVSSETAWGNPVCTQATFDGVKAAGFTSVRIPVTWMGHIGEAPDYLIEESWMDRIYEVVGYAETAGLKVILNTHHDEDHGDAHWQNLAGAVNSEDINKQVKEEIAAVWKQIAIRFKDKGDFLMLEGFNELIYGTEWSSSSNTEKKCNVINEWNQVFVDAVRATGGNNETRWLGVPGYAASPNYLQYLTVPNDPVKNQNKIMLAFHCYDPYNYTIGDAQLPNWGHTGTAYPKGEEEIKTLFNSIYTNYISKDIPIYMGEFGCSFRNAKDAKAWAYFKYYLEYVVKAAKVFGISAFVWDNGSQGEGNVGYGKESHCYINHGTGAYMPNGQEPVETMIKAWYTTDASYTLQSVYDSAPKF